GGPQARHEERGHGCQVEEESGTAGAPVRPLHERDAETYAEDHSRPDADGARRPHRSHRGWTTKGRSRCSYGSQASDGSPDSCCPDGSSWVTDGAFDGAFDAAHDWLRRRRWCSGAPQGRRCGSPQLSQKLVDDQAVLVLSRVLFLLWLHVGTSDSSGQSRATEASVGNSNVDAIQACETQPLDFRSGDKPWQPAGVSSGPRRASSGGASRR